MSVAGARESGREIAIVGGGIAGAAIARALGSEACALIAPPAPPCSPEGEVDARVYAISPGNAEYLQALGAWQAIPGERLAPVHAMTIRGDDGKAELQFDALDAGVAQLAWIVEDSQLQRSLRQGLEVASSAPARELEPGARAATLTLEDGSRIEARLVIGADGARSRVREAAGIGTTGGPYGQTAVVANFDCERPHRGTAFQWFQGGPVMALLPLPGDRVSLVWSMADAEAARLAALPADALAAEVERASASQLGAMGVVTPARTFPLRRERAVRLIGPRVALVGDAAHVVHPLAGQGANLALQDARVLAGVLRARAPLRDPGEETLLRRYERARAEPLLAMDAMVHGLHGLFGAAAAPLARLRNAGLGLVERLPLLKNQLMRRAMA